MRLDATLIREATLAQTRRHFFGTASLAALNGIFARNLPAGTHFTPTAKRVIYLHLVGAPPQMDMFDHKPKMAEWFDKELPESVRMGQRLTTMTSGAGRLPVAPSPFRFGRHGQSGAWVSELLPHTARMVDDLAIVRSLHTEAINHEPAITFIQTGSQIPGKPCMGAWVAYGLGSLNQSLPAFVVLNATHTHPKANVQAISARLWSAGFLSSEYSGVAMRSSGDPVLFLKDPDGVTRSVRRDMLDCIDQLNRVQHAQIGDPETLARVQQYEMAFRMQQSVPELTNVSGEPDSTYKLYGDDARRPGTFAHTCLLARRMAERNVRFVQIYQRGWDVHSLLPQVLPSQCKDIDQACYALVQDLKQRGLLKDTLVLWAGEFGRTIYSQGKLTGNTYGRDHHPRCFTIWMAGGGVRPGIVYGETDDFSYNIVRDPVHIRDLQATILHCLGVDHERLAFKFQGLDQKLTGVEKAQVVKGLLS